MNIATKLGTVETNKRRDHDQITQKRRCRRDSRHGFLPGMTAVPSTAQAPQFKETVIAGGPDKFAEVRHVVLEGTNFDIGKKIGELA